MYSFSVVFMWKLSVFRTNKDYAKGFNRRLNAWTDDISFEYSVDLFTTLRIKKHPKTLNIYWKAKPIENISK